MFQTLTFLIGIIFVDCEEFWSLDFIQTVSLYDIMIIRWDFTDRICVVLSFAFSAAIFILNTKMSLCGLGMLS